MVAGAPDAESPINRRFKARPTLRFFLKPFPGDKGTERKKETLLLCFRQAVLFFPVTFREVINGPYTGM
ncbi:hypothetical protein SY88_01800 [Clostridiales bacterium PH28_bin88]|nr:hypothetical protein SY88_01800 [Clostridiales bacterium PH28_bin88]